jgi:hypothetical protein
MNTELITYNPPGQLPDAELDVLVCIDVEGEIETYEGYFDGEKWVDATGMPILQPVTAWANKPAGVDLRGIPA